MFILELCIFNLMLIVVLSLPENAAIWTWNR
jgi:hypothetical protein